MDGDGAGSQKVAFAGIICTPEGASQARGYLLLEDPAGAVTGEARAMQSYLMVIEPQTPIDVSAGPGSPPWGGAPSSGGAGLGVPGPGGPTNPEQPTTGPFPFPEPLPVQPVWGAQESQGNQWDHGNHGTSGSTLPTLPGTTTGGSTGASVSHASSFSYGWGSSTQFSIGNITGLNYGDLPTYNGSTFTIGSSNLQSGQNPLPNVIYTSWDGTTTYDPLPPP